MSQINTQHSDKYTVTFSNIPGFIPKLDNKDSFQIYDLFVKSVTFPSHTIDLIKTTNRAFSINHPISKKNENLDDITVTFKASEGMKNWYHIYSWIKSLREGENIEDEKFNRLNYIKEIIINFLDNQKREIYKYYFKGCYITNLGSLSLTNGEDSEITFDVTIAYEDFYILDGSCND